MAEITIDISEGSLRRDASGWSATRVCDVQNPGGSAISKPFQAALALESQHGITYGEPHPAIPGIRVSAIDVVHYDSDPDVYRINVEYRGDAEGVAPGLAGTGIKGIEVSTGTSRTVGARDVNGELMVIEYNGPEVTIPGTSAGAFSPGTESQTIRVVSSRMPVEAEWDVPTLTVVVTREMPVPSVNKSLEAATTVNASPWSGLAAKRWLCLGIDSTLNDSGSYDWRYIFAVAPRGPDYDTWQFRAESFTDVPSYSQGGPSWAITAVRLNNTIGNGIEFFDVYRPMNFQQLFGFSIPNG